MKKNLIFIFICASVLVAQAQNPKANKSENIILITLDGFRWQELFNGADSSMFRQQKHLKIAGLQEKFWRENTTERRKMLMPFFWTTIATKGQLYGNRATGCKVNVTNNQWFSYPGYNEMLTGRADNERVHSNDKFYNPNVNVLEFLNGQQEFKGKVAAFTSWDVFPYIINDKRSGVYVSTGAFPVAGKDLNDREKMMNQLITALPNPLNDVRMDAFTFYYGLEYIKKTKPRVMYFSFDETDDFAHAGEYGAYLNSANYTDRFIGELWDYIQREPKYKDKTTMIISVDHGRGNNAEDWKHHGQKIADADQIWMAVIGPDTAPLGEVKGELQLYQSQIAATLAAFVGKKFSSDSKQGAAIEKMTASLK
jgi:hypothetical protein